MRSVKIIWSIVLISFTLISFSAASETEEKGISNETNTDKVDSTAINSQNVEDSTISNNDDVDYDKIIVYYFHGNRRCISCRKLEANTRNAIDSLFADQLENGQLELQVINTDQPQNRHFTHDYRLFTKSVVLSKIKDGYEIKWKNLDKIWQLYRSKEAYSDYIQSELKSFMENN